MMNKTRISVKVVPGATQNTIAGWLGDTLRIRVRAAPEKGKANKAVVELLQQTFNLPKGSITIIAGHTSPRKIVELLGLSQAEVDQIINQSANNQFGK